MSTLPARGEVWWCELPPDIGRRPVVVLSRDAAIPPPPARPRRPVHDNHPRAGERGRSRPEADPVPRRSVVNLDSVESVSVAVLVDRLGRLADDRMRAICTALSVAVACDSAPLR